MRSRSARITDLAAEQASSSVRYSVPNSAEHGQRIRRPRIVGRRRGPPCREPDRQKGQAGQAP